MKLQEAKTQLKKLNKNHTDEWKAIQNLVKCVKKRQDTEYQVVASILSTQVK